MGRILLIEDESVLGESLREYLIFQEHQVDLVERGLDGIGQLRQNQYDLIITDWELPDMTGIEICKELRSAAVKVPILMMTGRNTLEDKEIGFEAGADDYLVKPVSPRELAMRAKALIRRGPDAQQAASPGGQPALSPELASRYEIISLLGQGGMGVVYKGKHNQLDRLVAIKMLLPHLATDHRKLLRFRQEAKALSALSHPNVVTVYDFGEASNGCPFFVTDFLEGVTLDSVLQAEGCLEGTRLVRLLRELCGALSYIHSKGIIHRDLKPANLMLVKSDSGEEQLKILDFGIAKVLLEQGPALTQTGEIFGSPLYMSPEQCLGEPLDFRSDIYAVGCIMYQSLTGKPPLQGETALQTMLQRIERQPAPFQSIRPDLRISSQLEQIAMKALAREPRNRYQSVNELAADLESVQLS